MASKLLNGYTFYHSEIGLYKKVNVGSILFKTNTDPEGNKGWLIRNNHLTDHLNNKKIEEYGKNWATGFIEKTLVEDLTEEERVILYNIIKDNFKPSDTKLVYKKLNLYLPEANISLIGDTIDIEDYIIFNIKDIKLIEYYGLDLKLIFKDGQSEYIVPNNLKIKEFLLSSISRTKKVMI